MVSAKKIVIRVAFLFEDFDSLWMGGRNYYKCLFNAINSHDSKMLQPLIFQGIPSQSASEFFGPIPTFDMSWLKPKSVPWLIRKFSSKIFRKDIIVENSLLKKGVKILSHQGYIGVKTPIRTISWLPDFQHIHLKDNFSEIERNRRNIVFKKICEASSTILISSKSSQRDLHNFSPDAYEKSRVLNFIGNFSESKPISLPLIQSKYQIKHPYFYIPNQFWKHKNHRLVVNALKILKQDDILPLVICSGSTYDQNNPDHFTLLKDEIISNNLHNQIKILGEIPYTDVNSLIYHSLAVINPSFFEGWSTVVEEARNLNKYQILSDIDVHREQSPDKAIFVDPNKPEAMALAMRTILEKDHEHNELTWDDLKSRYNQRKIDFANQYENIVWQTCKT